MRRQGWIVGHERLEFPLLGHMYNLEIGGWHEIDSSPKLLFAEYLTYVQANLINRINPDSKD